MAVVIFLITLLIIIFLWLVGVLLFADFSPKNLDTSSFKKLLVIYPHPDDEALTVGGLIRRLADEKKEVVLLVLTKGERGNEGAKYDESLKAVRMEELNKVAKILGISKIIQYDFGDNALVDKKSLLEKPILQAIQEEKPDLIFTYDRSGLYGHPDHIVVSDIVNKLLKSNFPKIKLFSPSLPEKHYKFIKLPIHMANDKNVLNLRKFPNLKLFLGFNLIQRIKALYCYQSQLYSFKKGWPRFLPYWLILSVRIFEYYYEEN